MKMKRSETKHTDKKAATPADIFEAMDRVFEEAGHVFKAADVYFGEHLKGKIHRDAREIKIEPSDQHHLVFIAPTRAYRMKMARTFIKMAWKMAWTGKATMKTKK
jgi:hypothetical protein